MKGRGTSRRSGLAAGAAGLAILAAAAGCSTPALESGLRDIDGHYVRPFEGTGPHARALVLVFVSNDCPIANRVIPDLRRLHERYAARGIRFCFVHANADESVESIRAHAREYGLPGDVVRDPDHRLVRLTGARVTPEAVVIQPDGRQIYRGRIDDRFIALGERRPEPTRRDLEEVLEAVVTDRPWTGTNAPAVGCRIAGVK